MVRCLALRTPSLFDEFCNLIRAIALFALSESLGEAVMCADPNKVKQLAESIAEIGLQEPVSLSGDHSRFFEKHSWCTNLLTFMLQIDVLEVEGRYYGFSGCHRYEVL